MKTFLKCFPVLLLMLCMSSVMLTPGCTIPIVSEEEIVTIDTTQPPPNGGVIIQSDSAGSMANGFDVWLGLPANFRVSADTSFKSFRWWGEYNRYPNTSALFEHRDFTYTYNQLGTQTIMVRGYRLNGTYRDTTAQVHVRQPNTPIDTSTVVNLKIFNGTLLPTGQYKYPAWFGIKRAKFFAHLTGPHRFRPGYVMGPNYDNPHLFTNLDTSSGYLKDFIITFDTCMFIEYCIWLDPLTGAETWDFADTKNSTFRRTESNGVKRMWVFFKGGNVTVWNGSSYTIWGNQGDQYVRYSSSTGGDIRDAYLSIRELDFPNPENFDSGTLYWQHDLINGGGINNAHRNVTVMPGTGHIRIRIDMDLIPPISNGLVNIKWGKDGQQAPGMFLSGYHYVHGTYQDVVGLQFFNF